MFFPCFPWLRSDINWFEFKLLCKLKVFKFPHCFIGVPSLTFLLFFFSIFFSFFNHENTMILIEISLEVFYILWTLDAKFILYWSKIINLLMHLKSDITSKLDFLFRNWSQTRAKSSTSIHKSNVFFFLYEFLNFS